MKLVAKITFLVVIFSILLSVNSARYSFASHTVIATPAGGIYSNPQVVSLNASSPSSIIYYTIDGSEPSNSSAVFISPITINSNTTLKAVAIDLFDNHTSSVITEIYEITTSTTITTQPEDEATRVDPRSIINATFSEPMNASTIDESTFTLFDNVGNQIIGTVGYDQITNTASFTSDPFDRSCNECLNVGRVYTATLDGSITDASGDTLGTDFTWSFQTGGAFTIELGDVETTAFIAGSAFEITPDPFDLDGSLVVQDEGEIDLDGFFFGEESLGGRITVFNVAFTTYSLNEVVMPEGYVEIYENLLVTVHETQRAGLVTVENKQVATSLSAIPPVLVPAPDLTATQFELYKDNAEIGEYSGIQGSDLSQPSPISSVAGDALPNGRIATLNTIGDVPRLRTLVFDIDAPASSSAQDLFDTFDIPSYPNPTEAIANEVIYAIPAFAIPYEDASNNFILTPRISKVYSGTTLFMNQSSFVETQVAAVRNLNLTLAVGGTDVGFSFGITDSPPPGTPDPPLDAPALFLDIGFVGDVDFSDPNVFQSSPKIDILVNKTLPGFPELPNGCPDFRLLFFNGNQWVEIQKLDPTDNFTDFCPFTLEPEHFSKFAVGGVKGQTIQTEQERDSSGGGGGGGRSRSTAITPTPSGTDVETSITTESGIVLIRFESVEDGSGQIKINANELSVFEEFFDELAFLSQDTGEHGMTRIDGSVYVTAGDVFDIDASAIMFNGKVEVTIPYDENTVMQFGPESAVKFIHYNEELGTWEEVSARIDENANTITGTLESLSPVAAAVILEVGATEVDTTYVQVRAPEFAVSSGSVSMSVNLKNMRPGSQEYVMIAQVLDEQGVATHIDWQAGTLTGRQESDIGMNWQDISDGIYMVQILVLTNLQDPWFLSIPVSEELVI